MTIAEKFGVDPQWAVERRIDYLTNQCADYKTRLDMAALEWDSDISHNTPLMERMFKWYMADVPALRKKLKRYTRELIMRLRGIEYNNGITEDMIQQARETAIEEIYPDIPRWITCLHPAHKDNNPSMYIKGYAYCFSCQAKMDCIDFVMVKEGVKFVEAVKFITGVDE